MICGIFLHHFNHVNHQLPTFDILFALEFRKDWTNNPFILDIHLHIVPL